MKTRVKMWILVALLCAVSPAMAAGWQKIDAAGLKEMMEKESPLVVFPLSRIEYNNLHIEGSVNIPLAQLAAGLPSDKSRKLVFYCLGVKCTASPEAADLAVELGYRNVYAFIEGLPEWIKAGYPTTTIERLPLATISMITPQALRAQFDQDPTTYLIDIRQKHDVAKGRITAERSLTIPLDDLIERLDEIPRDANVVICCQKGKRGPTAGRYLAAKGYTRVSCLKGGVEAWEAVGLPMTR